MLGKATTPGTATMRGAIDLAISCWVRSRSPQGFSRTTEVPCDTVGLPATTNTRSASGTER